MRRIYCENPVVIDYSKPIDDYENCILDFSKLPKNVPAVIVTNTDQAHHANYQNNTCVLKNVHIVHNEKYNAPRIATAGLTITNAAFVKFENVSISGFNRGIVFQNQTWCNTFDNCNIYNNNIGVTCEPGINMGENLRFSNSNIFNNSIGISRTDGGIFNLTNCSLDYNSQTAVLKNGSGIHMSECHVEVAANQTTNNFHLESPFESWAFPATVKMDGGVIWITGSYDEKVYSNKSMFSGNSHAEIFLNGVRIFNVKNLSETVVTKLQNCQRKHHYD